MIGADLKSAIALVLFLLPAPNLHAVEGASEPAKKKASSRENRESLRFSIMPGIGAAYFPVPAPAVSLTGAIGLDGQRWIELQLTRVTGVEFYGVEQLEIFANTLALKYKTYPGNSFYFDGGFGLRTIVAKHEGIFRLGKSRFEQQINTTGLIVGIGNRWQWSHFTLGCSWVEAFLPISQASTTKNVGTGVQPDEVGVKERRGTERAKDVDLSIRFSLGASF